MNKIDNDNKGAVVKETIEFFMKKAQISDENDKDKVIDWVMQLFSALFIILCSIDTKPIAVKTILWFLVKITEPNELDSYFKSLEKMQNRNKNI